MGNIVVIGPRASGKTTFLAGLAYWPKRQQVKKKQSRINVLPQNDDADKLQRTAINLIEEGDYPDPTKEVFTYAFAVEVKKRLSSQSETISLVARDYPGEMFHDLADFFEQYQYDSEVQSTHDDFWEECFQPDKKGCLILLPEWTDDTDRNYQLCLNGFLKLMDQWERKKDFRLSRAR